MVKAQEYLCTVTQKIWLTPTVFELTFSLDKPIQFKAGQFLSVIIPGAGPQGRDLRRAYSIASWPEKPTIELCIKKVDGGPGSTFLSELQIGSSFKGIAPYGDFVFKSAGKNVVFIATGTGVAPFRAMLASEDFKKNPSLKNWVLHGVRTEEELLYQDELKAAHIEYIPAVSKPTETWKGFRGRVTDYFKSLDLDWAQTDFYLCGNGDMIKEVKDFLALKNVPKESLHQEKYY